jgi:hypothetical protein
VASTSGIWKRPGLPPAEDSPSRRDHPTSLHRRRSGVPRSCWPAALPGPVEELLGGPGHARQVAPRALEASAQASVPPARPPSTGFLDQAHDPSTRSRKTRGGATSGSEENWHCCVGVRAGPVDPFVPAGIRSREPARRTR